MSDELRTAAEYVEEFCSKHNKTVDEALEMIQVKLFKEYEVKRDEKLNVKTKNSTKS